MVILTQVLSFAKRAQRSFLRRGIIDSLHLHVKGGTGGAGLPRYGGIGGPGGNVYVCAQKGLTLERVRNTLKSKTLSGKPGGESSHKGVIGIAGDDLVIDVPVGISVYNDNGVKLGEVNTDGEKLLIARGGPGGTKDSGYCGCKGQAQGITLDLKLIADVGLVGFPNAGKSTFLNAVSNAKPKIANYPFTTIRPQIGIIKYKDHREISVADLPGLIEGAHANIGMGHRFLKHVERTKLLLFVVDIQGFRLSSRHEYRSCLETVILLNKEIELYKPDLLERPAMMIVNKMDTENANEIYKELEPKLRDLAGCASEFDESIQPENVVKFDEILTASLAKKQPDEMQRIKDKIRHVIDRHEEEKYLEESGDLEKQLVARLKRQVEQETPILV